MAAAQNSTDGIPDADDRDKRVQTRFLATISHEIRTPLNGVIGMAQLLANTSLDAQQRDFVETIQVSGRHLLSLINDLLDLSRLETGELRLRAAPFDLEVLLGEVGAMLRPRCKEKGLTFSVAYPEPAPRVFAGDEDRLRQILMHVVGNAVKFTETGSVAVTVDILDPDAESVPLRIAVRDTGPGIDPICQESIFDLFTQVDGSTTRRYGGVGMGLAACRKLLDLMGGTIAVESRPEQGAVFTLALELPASDAALLRRASVEIAGDKVAARLLLVEDSPLNQKVEAAVLRKLGCRVDIAENGLEAVDAVKRQRYDLVFMDCLMPVMDGYSATRKMRELESNGELAGADEAGPLPIVAMTANASQDNRDRCEAAGMTDYVSKPIDIESLQVTVYRWVQAPGPPAMAPSESGGVSDATADASVLDREGALRRLGGDRQLYDELVDFYRTNTPQQLADLKQAISQKDLAVAERAAHSIKGASANIGAGAAREAAAALEADLNQRREARLMSRYAQLEKAFSEFRALTST